MTHPERVEEMQPVCVWCDHVLACHHCGTEQPYDDVSVLKSAITASEKRAETARDAALEEAAKEAEKFDRRGAEQRIAQAIRAMKVQRP